MKRHPYYQLRYMAGVPYLVTFGQGHADYLRDLQLNETGVFLWEHLEEAQSTEQLAALCLEHFHCAPGQYETAKQDICAFVEGLISRGLVLKDTPTYGNTYPYRTLRIADLLCSIYAPACLFSPEMLAFETAPDTVADLPRQHIYLVAQAPSFTENGVVIVRTKDLLVLECTDKFVLLFNTFQKVQEAHIYKDGSLAYIYGASHMSEKDLTEFSYAVRVLFFYFALQQDVVALHSASILYRDKLWLFSAPSGTGKSTHAELWKSLFDVPIINGDINLITLKQGMPMVCGNPWHGTSGIYDTSAYPLGGILLLKQGNEDNIRELSKDQQELYTLHRCISPTWSNALHSKNHELIKRIVPNIFIAELHCTPGPTAVHCSKGAIDSHLGNK